MFRSNSVELFHEKWFCKCFQLTITESAVRRVVAVLKPLEIALDRTGGVTGDHAVLAHIDTVLKTKLVGHLPLGTLAQPHLSVNSIDK